MSETKTGEPITVDFGEDMPTGTRELAVHEERQTAVAPADLAAFNAVTMMQMVERLALDERVDAGKLETVMRVANQQQDREREIQFYQDKNKAVRAMPLIRKDGRIVILDKAHPEDMTKARVQGHFEKWPDVQAAITPVLDRFNLTLTHKIDHADNQTVVIAVLTHDNGYREESGPMRLPLDTSGGKNNVQGAGSSQTYGMRYTARAICGLKLVGGQQDDDGNLTAMSDEPLNDQQQRRLEEAQRAFERGKEAYEVWFSSIPAIDRAWMIQTGRHAQFGGGALLPGTEAPKPAQRPAQAKKRDSRHDTSTPEGWVAQYEDDCAACQSTDDLAVVQRKGQNAIARLQENSLTALHERAINAGLNAYNRLSPADDGGAE